MASFTKTIFLLLFSCLAVESSSQSGVWAKRKRKDVLFLYNGIYQCFNNIGSAFSSDDQWFYVIGDTTCNWIKSDGARRLKDYIIYYRGERLFLSAEDVENELSVDEALKNPNNKYFGDIKSESFIAKYRIDSLSNIAKIKKWEDSLKLVEEKMLKAKQDELVRAMKVCREQGIVIYNWMFGGDYSAWVKIEIFNPYPKRVKYFWVSIKALNPVGDPAVDRFTGSSRAVLKGVGPIEVGGVSAYNFDNAISSNVVDQILITQIKFQFFDGSFKVINNPKSL